MEKLLTILGVSSWLFIGSTLLLPRVTIHNSPLVELASAALFLSFAAASFATIVLTVVLRRKLTYTQMLLPNTSWVSWAILLISLNFGAPAVRLETTYEGEKDQIIAEIGFGHGSVGGHKLLKYEVWKLDMGPPSEKLYVSWGDDYQPENKQVFDVSDEIPLIGKDRIIRIVIDDNHAKYEIAYMR